MQILPSAHVKRLVQPDYLNRVLTFFYNRANFEAVDKETGTPFWNSTDTDSSFSLGKSKTGLVVSKSVGKITNDKNTRIQTAEITVTGSHKNQPGRIKPIHAGVFYELLPLDTQVDESTVWVEAGSRLSRSMVSVEFERNWKNTKNTMMIVRVGGIPEKTKSSSVTLHYSLSSTYENIIKRGSSMYSPSAFANTSEVREIYELSKSKNINQISGGKTYFGDLEDLEEYGGIGTNNQFVKGQYIAYDSKDVKYLDINAFSSGFSKMVNTLKTYTDEAEIISQTEYTYWLKYGQSENSQSDKVILFDLLDHGTVDNEYSQWNGRKSEWQGKFVDIRIPETKSGGKTCAPVVYYSTTAATDISALPKDLSDTAVWSKERPSDPATPVTAVAVDFSKDTKGGDFLLTGKDTAEVFITMISPADEKLTGKVAINTALSQVRTSGLGEDPNAGQPSVVKDQTAVVMKALRFTSAFLPEVSVF
jgi:hypothetical protein